MYSQVVEVPEYIVEEENTTSTGIDRHISVWSLVEQDWSRAREGTQPLCPETGSREQTQCGIPWQFSSARIPRVVLSFFINPIGVSGTSAGS
jgi:hypothetical protein